MTNDSDYLNTDALETCMRCSHRWIARVKNPKLCPNCKSPYWRVPKGKSRKNRNRTVSS